MSSSKLLAQASTCAIALALGLLAQPAAAQSPQSQPNGNQASSQSPAPAPSDVQATAPANDVAPVDPAPEPRARMSMEEMQDKIEELQRQLDFMKQVAAEQSAGVASVQAKPAVSLPNGKPTFSMADGSFTATINAVAQFDAGNYFQDDNLPAQITGAARDLNGGTNARRARFGVGGKVFGDFDYNFLYEFGGSGAEDNGHIQELWFQYTGFLKPFHLRVGYFEPLVGMEANVSTNSIALLERASPAEAARNVTAGDSRAAIQFFGNDDFKKMSFANGAGHVHWLASAAVTGNTVGSTNSAASGFTAQPFDEQLGVIGRLAVAPYKGEEYVIHVGGNIQHVFSPNDNTGRGSAIAGRYTLQLRDRPELRIDGTRLVDTGALNVDQATVYGGEFGFQWKSLFGQFEYFKYEIDGKGPTAATRFNPDFQGWYGEASYILTGENRVYNPANGAFNGPVPSKPFSWKDHTWGAFEVAGRYSDLDLDYNPGAAGTASGFGQVRGGEQKVFSGSINWYLNPVIRFMLQGQHVEIERLNAAGLRLNQDYNTLAVRSQLAF